MEAIELPVEAREGAGSGAATRTRAKGRIPAVLYGAGGTARSIAVEEAELQRVLRGHDNRLALLSLKIAGGDEPAILKAVQRDPVTSAILHLDFQRVALDAPLTVNVPVRVEGSAPGVKLGGVLQQMTRSVRVRCLPKDIPAALVADVSKMEIGHVLTVADLKVDGAVTMVTPAGAPVVSIVVTHYEEEAAAATAAAAPAAGEAGAEPAQPEVIGEKEREERRLAKDAEKAGKAVEKAELKEAKAKEEKKK